MADPVITLPKILSLAPATVSSTPTIERDPILLLPDTRTMSPMSTAMPARPLLPGLWQGPVSSATVEVVDTAPPIDYYSGGALPPLPITYLPPAQAAAPWWKDPMKLGLIAAGVVVLALLLKKE